MLSTFETASTAPTAPTRYAVRQVLDQEYQKDILRRQNEARQARYHAGGNSTIQGSPLNPSHVDHHHRHNRGAEHMFPKDDENILQATQKPKRLKRDFFGRVIENEALPGSTKLDANGEDNAGEGEGARGKKRKMTTTGNGAGGGVGKSGPNRVWISYHEGFSNAVRKPISLKEFMRGL